MVPLVTVDCVQDFLNWFLFVYLSVRVWCRAISILRFKKLLEEVRKIFEKNTLKKRIDLIYKFDKLDE